MAKHKDISGVRFGALVALRFTREFGSAPLFWVCACDCGNETTVSGKHLRTGNTKSCGCLRKDVGVRQFRHGHASDGHMSPTYRSWRSMKDRCQKPEHPSYGHYGAKGIQVCAEWDDSFEAFLQDMGPRPDGLTLDRIDNSQGYSPKNCRWATKREQTLNRSVTTMVVIDGSRVPLADAASQAGLNTDTVRRRMEGGMSVERALSFPSARAAK